MEGYCCIKVVEEEFDKIGIQCKTLELGRVEIREALTPEKFQMIDTALRNVGLEILTDNKTLLIEKVKKIIYELVYLSDELPKQNFSEVISQKVNRNYTYVSSLFSGTMGVKIEKYIIIRKIDRVKELLVYDNLSLSEIAYLLKYSSVAHLSNQFKKVTGMTPASYRQLRNHSTGKSELSTII